MTAESEISIRPATVADIDAISRLVQASSRQFITPDYSRLGEQTLLSHQTPGAIQSAIEVGCVYLLAEADDQVVGVVGINCERRHLYHLFTASTHHRRGIGRQLWNAALLRVPHGPITVNSSRFAIGFYERLGFVAAGDSWEKNGVVAYPMQWESRNTS